MNDHGPTFDEETIALVIRRHREGRSPSRILREIIRLYSDVSTPDLMELMQNAFALPHEAVQCIGGWWTDHTGELSDAELDAFLIEGIVNASPR
ncbi:hypothetical protein [Nocardia testacea]|uniref:hypothetical protein n=1 Tax=Nocardia testacea TaxID=248551 RepID=UPI0012F62CF2|nr:hypothetical protein [Nocardia testacea]